MKNKQILIKVFMCAILLLSFTNKVFAFSLTPNNTITSTVETKGFNCESDTNFIYIFSSGINVDSGACDSTLDMDVMGGYANQVNYQGGITPLTSLVFLETNAEIESLLGGHFYNLPYDEIINGITSILVTNTSINITTSTPEPPNSNGLGAMVTGAETGIYETTGVTTSGAVGWAGDSLIKVFLGSALAVLLALRFWIVALIIIGAVVYFAYRVKLSESTGINKGIKKPTKIKKNRSSKKRHGKRRK